MNSRLEDSQKLIQDRQLTCSRSETCCRRLPRSSRWAGRTPGQGEGWHCTATDRSTVKGNLPQNRSTVKGSSSKYFSILKSGRGNKWLSREQSSPAILGDDCSLLILPIPGPYIKNNNDECHEATIQWIRGFTVADNGLKPYSRGFSQKLYKLSQNKHSLHKRSFI